MVPGIWKMLGDKREGGVIVWVFEGEERVKGAGFEVGSVTELLVAGAGHSPSPPHRRQVTVFSSGGRSIGLNQ